MACYKCGDGIETGKSFKPVDAPGTPNRRWICNECEGTKRLTVHDILKEEIEENDNV